jgi:hypothetical protein
MSILNRAGKLVSQASGFSGMGTAGKVGVGALIAGAGIKGMYDQVAPAAIDASMDVAFGDPQADQKVIGTDLTPSMMYGASGLPGSTAARRIFPSNAIRHGVNVGGRGALIGAPMVGAGIGGFGAAMLGKKFGLKGRGLAAASAAGAFIGGGAGLAGGVAGPINTARTNSQIMSQSPFYNQSALNAERLNASGNIVLGMHNQRRG